MFDLATLLIGTLLVTVIAMGIAAPIGLLSAIYLVGVRLAPDPRVVKPILEILAGIPSVVLGFFALTFINPQIVQTLFPSAKGFNLAAAGIGVGILTIPLIASVSEDAMRAVPPTPAGGVVRPRRAQVTTTHRGWSCRRRSRASWPP